MKFFGYGSRFWTGMEQVFDWMALNLLWFVTSLPVVTIGASTAALADVMAHRALGEEPGVLKSYFSAWKRCWKKATALWGLLLVTMGWLLFSLRICFVSGAAVLLPVAVVQSGLLLIAILSASYLFALCLHTDWNLSQTIRAALFGTLKNLPWSVLLAAIALVPPLLTLYLPQFFAGMLLFWIFFGVSALAVLQRRIFDHMGIACL